MCVYLARQLSHKHPPIHTTRTESLSPKQGTGSFFLALDLRSRCFAAAAHSRTEYGGLKAETSHRLKAAVWGSYRAEALKLQKRNLSARSLPEAFLLSSAGWLFEGHSWIIVAFGGVNYKSL